MSEDAVNVELWLPDGWQGTDFGSSHDISAPETKSLVKLEGEELVLRADREGAEVSRHSDAFGTGSTKTEVSIPAALCERLKDWTPYSSIGANEVDGHAVLYVKLDS